MADFNISENYEEEIKTEKRRNKLIPIVIVVVSALFVGLLVFLISSLIISNNKEKKEKEKTTEEVSKVSLNDSTVKKLYKSITYEAGPKYYNKFIKEESVTLDTFNNREKYYYALQFAKSSDFIDTNNKDENNRKIYLLPEDKLKHYMREFFGNSVTYDQNEVIVCEFSFDMPEGSQGTLKYLNNSNGYNTTFTNGDGTVPTKNHYAKLVSAEKNNTKLILKEKIVYINAINNNNLYDIEIYNDYNKTRLLETIKNVSDLDNAVDIENYIDRASTITYTFKESKGDYYFVSSKITN